uniref:Uncharacterized protein n=1 Tax=Panagrolaimus superbus TaxID=310955 RepID=A0A914Y740_9BILA
MKSDNPGMPKITRGDSTTSTQSIENEAEIMPSKILIPPSPLPALRKKSAPLWLNDYIESWVHEQRQIETCSIDAGSSHDTTADSIYSKSSPDESATSSSTTSTYNSEDNLNESICSDTNKADELITEVQLLRLVNDRQKEQIEQMNGEKRELLREVERLRQITNYVSNG